VNVKRIVYGELLVDSRWNASAPMQIERRALDANDAAIG
jgi:hypothetical protein